MNIVIIGAGRVGSYLAELLSKEEHDIAVVEIDPKKIARLVHRLDVAIRKGSGTDWQILDDLLELKPDVLIAVTDNDEVNLVSCSIAKQLGYPRTLARIHNSSLLNQSRLDLAKLFGVDDFVSPELLVAADIMKAIVTPGAIFVDSFAHGAVTLKILKIPLKWRKNSVPLCELRLPSGVMVGLISRTSDSKKRQVIFPHGSDAIKAGDEIVIIGETAEVAEVHHEFGITGLQIRSVVIIGGSLTAQHLARFLDERGIDVTVIEKDYGRCEELSEAVPYATVIHNDGTDKEFLQAEKLGEADLFVACTGSDEVNICACLVAKEIGCDNSLALIANPSYIPISEKIGVRYTISPRVAIASKMLSRIHFGTVRSLVSLYENRAEIAEVNVSIDSNLVGIPLSQLGPLMPKDFLFAMIQNRGRIMIANGSRILSPGDTAIVITDPRHVNDLRKVF